MRDLWSIRETEFARNVIPFRAISSALTFNDFTDPYRLIQDDRTKRESVQVDRQSVGLLWKPRRVVLAYGWTTTTTLHARSCSVARRASVYRFRRLSSGR